MNKLVKALDKHIEVRQSTADLGFGIGVLLVDLFLMFIGVGKYISEGYTTTYGITAKTFPKVVFIAGIVLSVILIMEALGKRAKHDPVRQQRRYRRHYDPLTDAGYSRRCRHRRSAGCSDDPGPDSRPPAVQG